LGGTPLTLANTGTPVGTFGNATNVAQVTVDSKGRITNIANVPITGDNWGAQSVVTSGVITGTGLAGTPVKLVDGTANGQVYMWNGASWTLQTLAGDVTGPINANTVVKLQNRTLAATLPTNGQVLTWNNGLSQWEPQNTVGDN